MYQKLSFLKPSIPSFDIWIHLCGFKFGSTKDTHNNMINIYITM